MNFNLNQQAAQLCQTLPRRAACLRIAPISAVEPVTCWDFGIQAEGGLQAGLTLAEICMAGYGQVRLTAGEDGPQICVTTDHPVAACMASQYAGWQLAAENFFAMGSGPMRAAACRETLLQKLGCGERANEAVGILETRQIPPPELCRQIAADCQVEPDQLTLLLAPTASQAGTVQVVARSVETALHKLMDLQFDLHRVVSGWGTAPLPPVAADDLTGIGRTNDAVLYGGRVTLWVRGDDASLQAIVQQVPSCSSPDYGQPFAAIFERYQRDFYKIDPQLFSPAWIRLINLDTGNSFAAGQIRADVLAQSFGG